ncbi:MAG: hypothetical protein A2020_11575 [Lentisphaerae bacterium GWF2_45_14]|nr:MAG: hypothetical protein A2020_11575 [Lentisphaerae bacterium GWF2_45_14]
MEYAYEENEFIPQWEPMVGDDDAKAVYDCVKSTFINEGKLAAELESRLASYFGAKHCILSTSGTMALFMAFDALGVRHGDEVIVPDITFAGTADSAMLCGAKAVCADINNKNRTVDISAVEMAITPKTRAVAAVHLNGHAADIDALKKICGPKGIYVLEDTAQSIGSRSPDGRVLGTLGDIATFSLASTKIITCAQGGFVLTNDDKTKDRLIELKDHGRLSRKWNHHPALGFNFKLTDIQCAMALSQLADLDRRLEKMKKLELIYRRELENAGQFVSIPLRDPNSVPWQFEIIFSEPARRQAVVDSLKSANIGTRMPYEPLHLQAPFETAGAFPNAESYTSSALWLPSSPKLEEGDIMRVTDALKKMF